MAACWDQDLLLLLFVTIHQAFQIENHNPLCVCSLPFTPSPPPSQEHRTSCIQVFNQTRFDSNENGHVCSKWKFRRSSGVSSDQTNNEQRMTCNFTSHSDNNIKLTPANLIYLSFLMLWNLGLDLENLFWVTWHVFCRSCVHLFLCK